MKLYYDKKSKNPTYFIQQGIRNGKKTTTRNVKTIGKHNDLLKITDDPLQYAKDMVKAFNDDIKKIKSDLISLLLLISNYHLPLIRFPNS